MMDTQTTQPETVSAPDNAQRQTIQLPSFQTYCGAHALQFFLPTITIWFSYQTPVAFKPIGGLLVVRQNDWGTATGRHLNAIDGGNKKQRVTGETFERMLSAALEK